MNPESITLHKAKHLLVAAGLRRWPQAVLGGSGEASTGFYADCGVAESPTAAELSSLTDEMARVRRDFRSFSSVQLTPDEAKRGFHDQPWKLKQAAAMAELDSYVAGYELDGVIDVCDCTVRNPHELRSIHPEKFLLTEAEPVSWDDRDRIRNFIRIPGELFPAAEPCDRCPHS